MSKHNSAFEKRQSRTRFKLRQRNRGLPRITIFKSNKYLYAQVIDDSKGTTIAAVNTLQKDFKELKNKCNTEAAQVMGSKLAMVMSEQGLKKVVFDKGAYKYHGKVKIIGDSLRKDGILN